MVAAVLSALLAALAVALAFRAAGARGEPAAGAAGTLVETPWQPHDTALPGAPSAGAEPLAASLARVVERVTIPLELQDRPVAEVEARLRALGLRSRREYRERTDCPAGQVFRLDPPPGSNVMPTELVVLFVARSPAPATRRVAWTTDVGPDAPAEVAGKMLDFLHGQGVHITFFVCGSWADKHPKSLQRMADEGHHLANHSYSHPELPKLSDRRIEDEIRRTENSVTRVVGEKPVMPKLFRPPYGSYNARVKRVVQRCGYRLVMWDVDPIDWDESRSADKIAAHILNHAKASDIILTHVTWRTLAAMPGVFAGLRRKGLEPTSVPALQGRDGS